MSNLGSLVVSLEANIARFSTDMGKAAHVAEAAMKRIEFAGGLAKAALGGIGAALSVGGLVSMVNGTIAATAKLKDMAEQSGGTVETLSAFRSVAKLAGTDMDLVVGSLQKLSKHMYEAAGGSVQAGKTFATLGISVLDAGGKLKRPDELMFSISQRLATMGDGAGKTAVLMELFGKSGANLGKFMADLGEKQSLQAKITSEQAARAEEFERAMARLGERVNQFKTAFVLELLPYLQQSIPLIKTAAEVTAAYFAVFVGMPLLVTAAATAVSGFIALMASAGAVSFGASILASFTAIVVGATVAATAIKSLTLVSGVLFAAWAGWEIGTTLKKQFLNVELFGLALAEGLTNVWEYIKFSWAAAVNSMQNTWGGFVGFIGRGMSKLPGFDELGQKMQAYGEAAKGATMAAIKNDWQDAVARNKANFNTMVDDAIKAHKKLDVVAKKVTKTEVPIPKAADVAPASAYAKYLEELDRTVKKLEENEYAAMRLKAVQLAQKEGITNLAGAYDRINTIQRQESQRAVDEHTRKLGDETAAYAFQTSILGLTALEQDKLTFAMQKRLEIDQMIASAKRSSKPLDDQAIADLQRQTDAVIALGQAQRDQRDATARSAATGMQTALNAYQDAAGNAAKQTADMINGGLQRMEDAIVSFAKTGKLSFSSLFSFMADEFLRQQVKMMMSQQMAGLSGNVLGNLGGVFSAIGAIMGMPIGVTGATGDFARMDRAMPMDIAMPMADGTNYVPYDGFPATLHKGEAVVPAAYNPANGAAGTAGVVLNQTVNIGNNVSASDVARAMQQAKAEAVATIYQSMRRNGVMASA